MSNPSAASSTATPRGDLQGALMEFSFAAEQMGSIAPLVFPVFEVAEARGVYGKLTTEQLLKNPETRRAPGAGYSRTDTEIATGEFSCEEHGVEEIIDDRKAAVYRNWFDAQAVATRKAQYRLLSAHEKRVADLIFNTTTYTGGALTTAVTVGWGSTGGKPVSDVIKAKKKVYDGTGLIPNAVVMSWKAFQDCRLTTEVRDHIASAGAGDAAKVSDITRQMLAAVFEVDFVLVGGMVRNTANEGAAASLSGVWNADYVQVCRVATGNDIEEPCIGRTFHWSADGSDAFGIVESYRDEPRRSEVIRVRHDVDEVLMYTEAGHLLTNVSATS